MENDKLVRLSHAISAAKTGADDWDGGCDIERDRYIEKAFADIPAVDAVEVRHGHWVTEGEAIEKDDYSLRDTCSVCGHCDWDCTESENFNFCPNCGARMDGEEEHNAKAD